MRGNSGSVFKNVLINPLVWIAWILTGFTLHYEGYENTFEIFRHPEVYQNLSIGTTLYVLLFNRQYKSGGVKLDIKQTLAVILETMVTILLIWLLTLSLIVGYFSGGERYKDTLTQKYIEKGWIEADKAKLSRDTVEKVREAAKNLKMESGSRYKVTPNADGSFTIEVEDE